MATSKISALTQLNDIMQCSICLTTFTDPRTLPCIHTFCFQCLQDMADKSTKKPGDDIQCPVCRKEFTIPNEGMQGVQKNFIMTSLIEVRNTLNQSKMEDLHCDICKEEDIIKSLPVIKCDNHGGKVLDCYCVDCMKVVCSSCFFESHRTHDFKDVNTVEEDFREIIKSSATIISTLAGELLEKKKKFEGKEGFVKKIGERVKEILQRSEEWKQMIDEHTKSLLSFLGEVKNRHLKKIQTEEDELEMRLAILESFSRYCDELILRGSACDVCRSKDELLRIADELGEDHERYIMRPMVSLNVTFQATDLDNMFKTINENIIGSLKEHNECFEDFAAVIGIVAKGVKSYKINLHRQSDIVSPIENVPTTVESCPVAAVYNNTIFITGIGKEYNEIWKYSFSSAWTKCGYLVQGREHHCAEFIGETLYICGGTREGLVTDSIEAYNALTEKNTMVGQLRFGCRRAASVAYKGSVYVFGGFDKYGKALDCVQVFNPVEKTGFLLSTPIPRPIVNMRAVIWEAYAILLGSGTCFIFDFDGKTWEERKQFKTDADVCNFGMVLENERIFVINGSPLKDYEIRYIGASSILNNEPVRWKSHGQLPVPFYFIGVAKLSLLK